MALANHRVKEFQTIAALENFIRTDGAILTVVAIFGESGRNSHYILVYTV